jgi:hypothetical protein
MRTFLSLAFSPAQPKESSTSSITERLAVGKSEKSTC